jgi:prepilin-type processing-associated H-X9-DG protein
MLLPAVGLVRSQAQGMKCLSNLRQMQLANIAYSNDNPGLLVPQYYNDSSQGWIHKWVENVDFLAACTDDQVVGGNAAQYASGLLCPLAQNNMGNPWFQPLMLSYGYNGQFPFWPPPTNAFVGPTTTKPGASDRISFTDALDWALEDYGPLNNTYLASGAPAAEGVYLQNSVAFRHRGRANAAFCDGHVATLDYQAMNHWGSWNP